MILKSILSDIKKNPFTTMLLFVFIFTSALLFSSALGMISELSTSITALMTKAQTPDFMQMHSGNIDYTRLEKFAIGNEKIKHFQVSPMLNIDGSEIHFCDKDLSGSVMDNGFCYQNELFDFLLDADGKIINVETEELQDGEIYIPLNYWKKFSVTKNDIVIVCEKEFTIKGFLRDSQMDSDMASSKRFLITKNDYESLSLFGTEEYLIEIKAFDSNDTSSIENEYIQAGLENNGPAITHSLFFLINALSSGVLIALIILISILLVFISFLCIRFTLLATLEDDYKEIGVMKAIGFYHKEISSLYLSKYSFIVFISCLFGFSFSFIFKDFLLSKTNLFISNDSNFFVSLLLGFIACIVLFFCIFFYVKHILTNLKKISSTKAIREDRNTEMYNSEHTIHINNSLIEKIFGLNIFIGIQDVIKKKRMFVTLFLVLILAIFIIIVPQNIYQTIKDSSFINYMGISDCNARIDLQQLPNMKQEAESISKWLQTDKDVEYFDLYTTRSFKINNNDKIENLKIECGDYSNNTIKYVSGNAPKTQTDIVLSFICANNLKKKIGDEVEVYITDSEIKKFKVCGIYSDVTNGGITAKIITQDLQEELLPSVMWYIFCIQYKNNATNKSDLYKDTFTFGKFTQVNEYIKQTVGSTIDMIALTSQIAFWISLGITILITTLFVKLLLAKDNYSISILYSLGFSKKDIRKQYVARIVFILLLSLIIGTLLANTLGSLIATLALSNIGIANLHFVIKPYIVYLLLPLSLLVVVLLSCNLAIKIKTEHI